jgi:hypothetical protein
VKITLTIPIPEWMALADAAEVRGPFARQMWRTIIMGQHLIAVGEPHIVHLRQNINDGATVDVSGEAVQAYESVRIEPSVSAIGMWQYILPDLQWRGQADLTPAFSLALSHEAPMAQQNVQGIMGAFQVPPEMFWEPDDDDYWDYGWADASSNSWKTEEH